METEDKLKKIKDRIKEQLKTMQELVEEETNAPKELKEQLKIMQESLIEEETNVPKDIKEQLKIIEELLHRSNKDTRFLLLEVYELNKFKKWFEEEFYPSVNELCQKPVDSISEKEAKIMMTKLINAVITEIKTRKTKDLRMLPPIKE